MPIDIATHGVGLRVPLKVDDSNLSGAAIGIAASDRRPALSAIGFPHRGQLCRAFGIALFDVVRQMANRIDLRRGSSVGAV